MDIDVVTLPPDFEVGAPPIGAPQRREVLPGAQLRWRNDSPHRSPGPARVAPDAETAVQAWCRSQLKPLWKYDADVTPLIQYAAMQTVRSDVFELVHGYVGNSASANAFADEFFRCACLGRWSEPSGPAAGACVRPCMHCPEQAPGHAGARSSSTTARPGLPPRHRRPPRRPLLQRPQPPRRWDTTWDKVPKRGAQPGKKGKRAQKAADVPGYSGGAFGALTS